MASESPFPAVLLAEDCAVIRDILAEHLQSSGCTVDLAENGREAVEAFRRGACDLVLLDAEMPGMEGHEAVRLMRSSEEQDGPGGRIPIIAMTSDPSRDFLQALLDAGMDGSLQKPVKREILLREVQKWTGFARSSEGAGTSSELPAGRDPINVQQAIGNLFEKEEFLRSVAETFLGDLNSQLDEIAAAIERKEGERLGREAHSIKGAALFLTADRLGSISRALEESARGGDFDTAVELLPHLREEARLLEKFVKREIGRTSGPV